MNPLSSGAPPERILPCTSYSRESSETNRESFKNLVFAFRHHHLLSVHGPSPGNASRAYRSNTQLAPDDRRHLSAEDFYGAQHFFVWQRGDTHLECDAGDAAQNVIHIKDLLRDRFGVADKQRPGRPAQSGKLSAGGGWPAAFLADLGKRVCVAWKEYFCGFVRGVREKANGMKTYGELFGRMTGATPGLAIELYKRPEASGLTADDGNHERKSEQYCRHA